MEGGRLAPGSAEPLKAGGHCPPPPICRAAGQLLHWVLGTSPPPPSESGREPPPQYPMEPPFGRGRAVTPPESTVPPVAGGHPTPGILGATRQPTPLNPLQPSPPYHRNPPPRQEEGFLPRIRRALGGRRAGASRRFRFVFICRVSTPGRSCEHRPLIAAAERCSIQGSHRKRARSGAGFTPCE